MGEEREREFIRAALRVGGVARSKAANSSSVCDCRPKFKYKPNQPDSSPDPTQVTLGRPQSQRRKKRGFERDNKRGKEGRQGDLAEEGVGGSGTRDEGRGMQPYVIKYCKRPQASAVASQHNLKE